MRFVRILAVLGAVLLATGPVYAQQTGSIAGKVVDNSGGVLPGVTVEASSNVLPTPRVTTTGANGEYRLPALPPGVYTVTFTLAGMQTVTRQVPVQLQVEAIADVTMGVAGVTETVEVTATRTLVDPTSATLKSGVSSEQISNLPVGQEYRDLLKLIPAVQYTQDAIRGPSAGGSGQDNVYQFDGANVTLPLFGTLSAEPASHDIEQITTVRGGARAIDFDRSGGFTIDSVSKSGTNHLRGEISFEYQGNDMVAKLNSGSLSRYEQDRQWLTIGVGGPIVPEKLFFYGSYYRPESSRENRANVYGDLPDYQRTRNEGFGKLTFTPISSLLFNGSYRYSHRHDKSSAFGSLSAPTTGTGDESWQKIGLAEASWVINSRSHATFKWSHFGLETSGRPDNIATVSPSNVIGTQLDLNNLDKMGLFVVPSTIAGEDAYNAFVQQFIDRYGYVNDVGVRTGGGRVGYASEFNDQDFFRDSAQFAYNITFGGRMSHDLHFGYQWSKDKEDLLRSSNGWGIIEVPGGRFAPPTGATQPAYFQATFQQQTTGQASPIISEYRSHNIEINDTIRWNRVTLNVGVLASQDTLYGQGLRKDSSATLTGFRAQQGVRYEMYKIPFSKMIQPRLSATWAYNDTGTIYASYAQYNPAASSLPRAASWDRNLIGTFIDAYFDQNGVLFAANPRGSSSGKLFVEDLTPRTIDEYMIGTSKQFTNRWSGRLYYRYREGKHFWEDTNNNARSAAFGAPPDIAAKGDYIKDLSQRLAEIGSGSTYVIAELDGAFTEYNEVTFETEWRGERTFLSGSYTWSRYYGNFDQDNTTTVNDANIFMGSSFIADGIGRQLWDNREGRLRGDRPHMFKVFGTYSLPWRSTMGAFFVAQSGHPWEGWSSEPYRHLTSSTSVTSRYAEPAGSRRTDAHYQLDFKYIQDIRVGRGQTLQLIADLYNVFNKQTGYNPNPDMTAPTFGVARNFFDPRRLNVTVRFRF
jgi:hypothetical protein